MKVIAQFHLLLKLVQIGKRRILFAQTSLQIRQIPANSCGGCRQGINLLHIAENLAVYIVDAIVVGIDMTNQSDYIQLFRDTWDRREDNDCKRNKKG